jgi:hypothetical protein
MGATKDVIRKGILGFEFLHFLSVAVSSLNGNQMAWWLNCNLFMQ